MRRAVWLSVGAGALALGALGILLPVLPTAPFVILAAFAFGRSAPRMAARLEESRSFGPILGRRRDHGAIAPRHKAMAVATRAGAFGLGVAMSVAWAVPAVQAVCMMAAAAFILSRPNGTA